MIVTSTGLVSFTIISIYREVVKIRENTGLDLKAKIDALYRLLNQLFVQVTREEKEIDAELEEIKQKLNQKGYSLRDALQQKFFCKIARQGSNGSGSPSYTSNNRP